MARVKKLVLENYRGASTRLELDFEQNKGVALLFGENGTGKTTIADAFDAVGNGSRGSLEEKSSTRARDHLPTIGKKASDIRIQLEIGTGVWRASLAGDALITTPSSRPKIRVLRRNQLQRLTQAQPAQRYEELRRFIEVGKVEESENALKTAVSSVNDNLNAATARRIDAETRLREAWEAEGRPAPDALTWAKTLSAKDSAALENEAHRLRELRQAVDRAEGAAGRLKEITATLRQREGEAHSINGELKTLPGIDAQKTVSLVTILTHVRDHLATGNHPDECPVCRQAIPISDLKADVASRLAELQQYDTHRKKVEAAKRGVQAAADMLTGAKKSLVAAARALFGLLQAGDLAVVSAASIAVASYVELAKREPDLDLAASEADQLIKAIAGLKEKLADTETSVVKQSAQVGLVRTSFKQLVESVVTTEEFAELHPLLKKAHEIVRQTRIQFTQRILDDVATECNRMYSNIHPGEPLAISRLELDQARRASLTQAANFEGFKDVPPQAYFSEAHLDTLGFCFWLATAKRESKNADSVVVLDDVFSIVDVAHLRRIAQLIADESQYFAHVIVTTHQRVWRDLYRYQQAAGKVTQVIELQRWTLGKGIAKYETRLAVDDLIASIGAAPFDRQVTALRAGVLLEACLYYLSLQYRCPIPNSHDGEHKLGELLDGTESLFKKLELHRPEVDPSGQAYNPPRYMKSSPATIFAKIRGLSFLRNQVGAHFNPAGSAISDADVQEFADLTVKLAESLACATCGQIPGRAKGSYFQCSCIVPYEARLLPLQR